MRHRSIAGHEWRPSATQPAVQQSPPAGQPIRARLWPEICAFAYVVEGEGFAAATIGAAASLINMAQRQPFPLRVFATIADAVSWALPRLPGHPLHDGRSMIALVDEMRRQTKQSAAAG